MKVLIVTPSFNSVETINRTIQSVVYQAGDFNLQYHVQDGGSTDGTVNVLKRWAALLGKQMIPICCRSVTFTWDSSPDEGMYDAIAKSFSRFKGEANDWLAWINADDILLPTALPLLLKIDNNPNLSSKIHWVTGSAATCRDNCQDVMSDNSQVSEVISLGLADGKHWAFVQQEGTFFRQHAWQKVGGGEVFTGFKYAGDWNLWRQLAQHYKIYQSPFALGMFSSRPGQLSQTFRNDYEMEMSSIIPPEVRSNGLLKFKGEIVEALYLQPDLESGSLRVEKKTIKKHLAYRVAKIIPSAKTEKNKTKPQRRGNIVYYDAEWQFPAITEQHAFDKVKSLLPDVAGIVYFAFPWATLIDLLHCKKEDAGRLRTVLSAAGALLRPGECVVTVCQHVLMLKYQSIFDELRITAVFWPHAVKKQDIFPQYHNISIYPFPLYPVQAVDVQITESQTRPILYSFIGAKSDRWYLTQSRNYILDYLGKDKLGTVIGRDSWHYKRAVYEHQVSKKNIPKHELVDKNASDEFKDVLKSSIFSLCPSGSGPNSIRLWESIGFGTIPVILSDTYLPPGNQELWDEAVVFCNETEEAIKALPARLEQMARDEALIARKRHAMKQLWMLYGPDCFVYDIHKLFVDLAAGHISKKDFDFSYAPLLRIAEVLQNKEMSDISEFKPFLLGCSARMSHDHEEFLRVYKSNSMFKEIFNRAMKHGHKNLIRLLVLQIDRKRLNHEFEGIA